MTISPEYALFEPLSKRPEATTLTIRDLLRKFLEGKIRIPEFQRPLRWRSEDILALFDSLWRGYPIGSLLMWKRPADAGTVHLGTQRLEVPAVHDAWWVVDGQQRLTSLAACLLEFPGPLERRWHLSFNPEKSKFEPGLPSEEHRGIWVPSSALGDLKRLNRWLRDTRLESDELQERVEDAQQRLLDYAIPIYVVETDNVKALGGVFARLNATGARMRADEVFQALLGTGQTGHQTLDLTSLQKRCNQNDFGEPPRTEVLKAVLSMSGLDPSRRLEALSSQDLATLIPFEEAEAALIRTVEFLQQDCDIPHIKLLPYPVVFFILAKFFHLFPDPAPETRRRLARWLWCGIAGGSHERADVSKMRLQVRAIQFDKDKDIQESEERSIRGLERQASRPSELTWELQPFNLKSARSRVEVLAMLTLTPEDPGGPFSLGALVGSDRMAREIFVGRDLDRLEEADKQLARTAANRLLFEGSQQVLYNVLRHWSWDKNAQALRSHLFDRQSFEALTSKDITLMLQRRAVAIQRLVETFLEKRLRLNRPLIKPLDAYVEADTYDDEEP
ncbi:MAG: DUF262 domain-containing protein [Myxococcota bacterium]